MNVNWYSHYEQWRKLKKKLKIKLPYDPIIPLLGVYPEKTVIQKGTCSSIFTEALFTYLFLRDQKAILNS